MVSEVKRKLSYDDRVALQQADQAIRKDVVRALVELITNSNDSYSRLEDKNQSVDGKIIIEICRKHQNPIIRVSDYAEGLSGEGMDTKIGNYGAATSGFQEGHSVRGLWGRGLKDSFYGLGHGDVKSICENVFNFCRLYIEKGTPMYERDKSVKATRAVRKQFNTPTNNGTIIEITVSRDDVRIKQFNNLKAMLERHFELREIMSNPKRQIFLREVDHKGRAKQETKLEYKYPKGVLLLKENLNIPNYPTEAVLEVYRSEVPLTMRSEEDYLADGGLLVISRKLVLDLTLLKYENDDNAARLYGKITCDFIHDLLKKKATEPILTATRDGINWKHDFAKAVKLAVESRLAPLVENERQLLQAERQSVHDEKFREKIFESIKEINSIVNMELGDVPAGTGEDGHGGKKSPALPLSGYGFIPEYVQIQTGKPASLVLRAIIPDKVSDGTLVKIESDSGEVVVHTQAVVIKEREDFRGLGEAIIEIEGRQVGAEAVITASTGEHKAEALVKVISKKVTRPPGPPIPRGGLFRDIRFDPTAEPKQRVKYDRSTGDIIISSMANSVALYFDPAGCGGSQTPQGQVLLAELITEAVCREIARRGVESEKFLSPHGAETDAINRESIRLQNQYSHRIHACYVDPKYRLACEDYKPKKGRPKKIELLSMHTAPI